MNIIEEKEYMDAFEKACEISQQLESKQYLNYYEDKEHYNLYNENMLVKSMVIKRAEIENYTLVDQYHTLYLFPLTGSSVYGYLPYEIKNKIIDAKSKKNSALLSPLIQIVLVQYFLIVEKKQDRFSRNLLNMYPIEQFIETLDNTFAEIRKTNQDNENYINFDASVGNILEVANYWDKMSNVDDEVNNGIMSKYKFVKKTFDLLKGDNEQNGLIVVDGEHFRPTKKAFAFVSNAQAETLREKIQNLESFYKEKKEEIIYAKD